MALVSAVGGPDARPESLPPRVVPVVFLILAALSAGSMVSVVAAYVVERAEGRTGRGGARWGGLLVGLALLVLAVACSVARKSVDQGEAERRQHAEEQSRRLDAEGELRRRAAAPPDGGFPGQLAR